jgi:hypothetical protein
MIIIEGTHGTTSAFVRAMLARLVIKTLCYGLGAILLAFSLSALLTQNCGVAILTSFVAGFFGILVASRRRALRTA